MTPISSTSDADIARLAAPLMPSRPPPEIPDEIVARARASMGTAPDLRSGLALADPGGGGFANGRSIARVCAILANGGQLDGVRYLSPAMAAQASEEQCYEDCPFFGTVRMGLGFALGTKEYPMPAPSFYHWGGFGGSVGLIDPEARISLGYAPNNMVMTGEGMGRAETRQARFLAALKDVLGTL